MVRGNWVTARHPYHGFYLMLSVVFLLSNSMRNLAMTHADINKDDNNHVRRREHRVSRGSGSNIAGKNDYDDATETRTTETVSISEASRKLIAPPQRLSCQPHVIVFFARDKFFSVLGNLTTVNNSTLFDGVSFSGRIHGSTEDEDVYEDAAIFNLGGSQGNALMLANGNGDAPASEGGEIRAEFESVGTVQFLKFLRIEKDIQIDFYDVSGTLIDTKKYEVNQGNVGRNDKDDEDDKMHVVPSHIMAPQVSGVKSMRISLEGRALLDDVSFNRTCPPPQPICFPFQLVDFKNDDDLFILEDGDAISSEQQSFAGIRFRATLSKGDLDKDNGDNVAYIQTVPTPESDLFPIPDETNTLIIWDNETKTMQPSPNGGTILADFDNIGNQMGHITFLNVEKRLKIELFDKKGRRRVQWLQMIDGMLDVEVVSFSAPAIKSMEVVFGGRGALEKVEFTKLCEDSTPPSSSPPAKSPPSPSGKSPPSPSSFGVVQGAPPSPTPVVDNIMTKITSQSGSSPSSLPYLCKDNVTIDFSRFGMVFQNDTLINPNIKYDTGVSFRAKRNGEDAHYDDAYVYEMEGKQRNVLIVSKNGKKSASAGGEILAEFEIPVFVESIRFLEVEKSVVMEYFDELGSLIGAPRVLEIPPDETMESVKEKANIDGVKSMRITLEGGGAVDDLSIQRSCDDNEEEASRCHFTKLIDFSADALGNPLSNGTFVDDMAFENVRFRVKRTNSEKYDAGLIYTLPNAKNNTLAIAGANNKQQPSLNGGMIVGEFDPPVRVERLTFAEAEKKVGVELLDAKGELLLAWQQRLRGRVESTIAEFHISNVTTMNIRLGGRGSIDNLWFYFQDCSSEDDNGNKLPTQGNPNLRSAPPSPPTPSSPPRLRSVPSRSPPTASECHENVVIDFEKDANDVVLKKGDVVDETRLFNADASFKARRYGDDEDSFPAGMIFDASMVTGNDHDLFSPASRNILIISEDLDSSDPDDNAKGGWIVANFTVPVRLKEITFLDIDNLRTRVDLFGESTLLESISISSLPDGTKQVVTIGVDQVKSFVVSMSGSGAIDEVSFSRSCETPI